MIVASLHSLLPFGRVSGAVKNCKNENSIPVHSEVDSIGKLARECAAYANAQILKRKRIFEHSFVRCAKLVEKFATQAHFLSLVPIERAFNIKFDGWFGFESVQLHFKFCDSRSRTSNAGVEALFWR